VLCCGCVPASATTHIISHIISPIYAYDRPAADDDLLWPAIVVGRSEKPAWRLPTWTSVAVLVLQAVTCVAVCSRGFAQWRDRDSNWGNDTLHMRMSAFAHFANRIFD
jgi:hypothetical protein